MGVAEKYLRRMKMRNTGAFILSLTSLISGELAPRYLPLVPHSPSGQGYNPGLSSSFAQDHGEGYNPGGDHGQGYNPGVVAFSANKADKCCTSFKLKFERT